MITNKNCIIRLSRYKNALYRLRSLGFVKVFSENLADAVGVTASQVRKDFSLFGISGNRRGGYEVSLLLEKLGCMNRQIAQIYGTPQKKSLDGSVVHKLLHDVRCRETGDDNLAGHV
ncbi:MAG TPA: winged-helix domain-containing protein [bacterium]|nr:winged-helix domain-containing protein [bacterium]